MIAEVRRRLTYANVMATIAVFVSLGAGAYALSRNSVQSRHIAPGAVRLGDTSDKLRLKCPAKTRFFEGACVERSPREPATADAATADCADENRRLPDIAELEGFREEPGVTLVGYEWTSAYYVSGGNSFHGGVGENETGYLSGGGSGPYRCVARAKR